MKKVLLSLTALVSLVGQADVLTKEQAAVGDEGGGLFSKIEEVTRRRPTKNFKGQTTISANATVTCIKATQEDGSDGFCIVTVKK